MDPFPECEDTVSRVERIHQRITAAHGTVTLSPDEDKKCQRLIHCLQLIGDGMREIHGFADEYNVPGVRSNGYWSCMRIGGKLIQIFHQKYEQDLHHSRLDVLLNDSELLYMIEYFVIAINVLLELRNDSVTQAAEPDYEESKLIASSTEMFVQLFTFLLHQDDRMVATMYGPYCGFWLDRMARYTMILFVTTIAMAIRPKDALKCLYDSSYRGLVLANLTKTADVSYVKRMGSLPEISLYKSFLPMLLYGSKPRRRDEFFLPRQNKWVISPISFKLEKCYETKTQRSTHRKVRVRLFLHEDKNVKCNSEAKLLIHVHGGGFVIGSPESNEVYIRDWANKMPNIPILSIGYSVSPEAKFPVALQEVLDAYLFLTSNDPMIFKILGFQPKFIGLCGDSAGASILTAMTMVLNDIRHFPSKNDSVNKDLEQIIMPKFITCLYTPFNLSLRLSPSIVLSVADSMISAGVMLSCFEAYLPAGKKTESRLPSNDYSPFTMTVSLFKVIDNNYRSYVNNMITRASDIVNGMDVFGLIPRVPVFGKLISDPPLLKIESCDEKEEQKLWYLKPKPELRQHLQSISHVTQNAYVSPIFYHDFQSLSDVDLNVIALHYDPFLDDSITFFKKWKGKKTFNVLDGLQHGFLNFMPFVPEAKRGSNLTVEINRKSLCLD